MRTVQRAAVGDSVAWDLEAKTKEKWKETKIELETV
jgi:hypothetical protein